jgi:hypothetical protein
MRDERAQSDLLPFAVWLTRILTLDSFGIHRRLTAFGRGN